MKIIIIEDERITAEDLAITILKAKPQAKIEAILGSVKESLDFFANHKHHIDLIFSDIQLGDGSSFDVFEKTNIKCPVIFCTAYDQYALRAFEMNGIHYLLKPFDLESVKTAFKKYEILKENLSSSTTERAEPATAQTESAKTKKVLTNNTVSNVSNTVERENVSIKNLKEIIESLKKEEAPKSVLVYHKDKILPIKLENVALFHIENEVTKLVTYNNTSYRVNKPMEELEATCGDSFFRVNRQFLINRDAIIDTAQYFNRKLVVNLSIELKEKVVVSKAKAPTFLNWLMYT
ncbi:MAG: LytTR family DNA-binding domain-containing protein [Bacteroidales bacterium]